MKPWATGAHWCCGRDLGFPTLRVIAWRVELDQLEIEVLRGIEIPKMSPRRRHARLQSTLLRIIEEWAGERGEVCPEWRCWISRAPQDEETSLVPDIAFVSLERLAPLGDEDAEEPPFAPDIAVEIRSPGDRERNIRTKAALYLSSGAHLVLDVDPARRVVTAFTGTGEQRYGDGDIFTHSAFPGLSFDVRDLFSSADRKVVSGATPEAARDEAQ